MIGTNEFGVNELGAVATYKRGKCRVVSRSDDDGWLEALSLLDCVVLSMEGDVVVEE